MTADPVKTVYLVDDEADIRTVAAMSLGTIAGWSIEMFAEPGAMLAFARGHAPPDVLLLDVMMPGMDGVTLLGRLREIDGYADVPAVFVTARAQRHEVQGYLDAGAAGVITKPFDPMSLPDRVRDLVREVRPKLPAASPLSSRLAALREVYVGKLPDKVRALGAALDSYLSQPGAETHRELRVLAHKLHGTGGSYGFGEISQAASALERLVVAAGEAGLDGDAVESARGLVDEIARLVTQI
jgi:CheY-like chemotaxis protein